MRALVVLLTLSLTLAGCIGGKDAPEEDPIEEQSVDETSSSPAPTPTPSSRPSSRPAPPTPPKPPTPPTPPTPMGPSSSSNASVPSTVVVEGDAGAALIVAAPGAGSNGAMVGFAVLDIPRASPRSALLLAEWTSQTPLDASMDIALFDTEGNTIATASGASPIMLEMPGEAFGTAVEIRGSAFPTAPGVGVEYSVHFVLTVLYA